MGKRTRNPLRTRGWLRLLIFVVVASATALLFRQGLVAPAFNPLPLINVAKPSPWLVDWRLASIKNYPEICARTLNASLMSAEVIPDSPLKDGCGWQNSVRLVSAAGVRAPFSRISCEMAVALTLWFRNEVQPLARDMFGQEVKAIDSFGSYSCRNIAGDRFARHIRSQHATANAADIGGFQLANGKWISVRGHWKSDTPEGRFLRAVHSRACPYFRLAIGPDYNAAHHDHFHLDRGPFSRCK